MDAKIRKGSKRETYFWGGNSTNNSGVFVGTSSKRAITTTENPASIEDESGSYSVSSSGGASPAKKSRFCAISSTSDASRADKTSCNSQRSGSAESTKNSTSTQLQPGSSKDKPADIFDKLKVKSLEGVMNEDLVKTKIYIKGDLTDATNSYVNFVKTQYGLRTTEQIDIIPDHGDVIKQLAHLKMISKTVEGPFFKVIGPEGGCLLSRSEKTKLEFEKEALKEKVLIGLIECEGLDAGYVTLGASATTFPDKYPVTFKHHTRFTDNELKDLEGLVLSFHIDDENVSDADILPNTNPEYRIIERHKL